MPKSTKTTAHYYTVQHYVKYCYWTKVLSNGVQLSEKCLDLHTNVLSFKLSLHLDSLFVGKLSSPSNYGNNKKQLLSLKITHLHLTETRPIFFSLGTKTRYHFKNLFGLESKLRPVFSGRPRPVFFQRPSPQRV